MLFLINVLINYGLVQRVDGTSLLRIAQFVRLQSPPSLLSNECVHVQQLHLYFFTTISHFENMVRFLSTRGERERERGWRSREGLQSTTVKYGIFNYFISFTFHFSCAQVSTTNYNFRLVCSPWAEHLRSIIYLCEWVSEWMCTSSFTIPSIYYWWKTLSMLLASRFVSASSFFHSLLFFVPFFQLYCRFLELSKLQIQFDLMALHLFWQCSLLQHKNCVRAALAFIRCENWLERHSIWSNVY